MELQYCIMCEYMDCIEDGFHTYSMYMYPDTPELMGCTGPFASCPPPEYDLDYWEWLFLQEPVLVD